MPDESSQIVYVVYFRNATSKIGEPDPFMAQRTLVHDYVTDRGGTIVAEFSDPNSSGHDLDRRGLREMMLRVSNGGVDAVLVAEPSRLGRGRAYFVVEREVTDLGVRIEFASSPVYESIVVREFLQIVQRLVTKKITTRKK